MPRDRQRRSPIEEPTRNVPYSDSGLGLPSPRQKRGSTAGDEAVALGSRRHGDDGRGTATACRPKTYFGSGAEGFTLIELLVVLAIIGIVLGLAMPMIGNRSGVNVAGAATQIRAALRNARDTAVFESRAIAFRGENGGYWIDRRHYRLDGPAEAVAAIRIAVVGGARISFFPSGGSSGGSVLVSAASLRREIAVDPLTGRADLVP